MNIFNVNDIALTVLGYPISYIEFIGTLFGFITVYLASRANILTWSAGIVNVIFLFLLFFQVQLYADMFLQLFFFVTTLYGWYVWGSKKECLEITRITAFKRYINIVFIIIFTILSGLFMLNIHNLSPTLFKEPASFPFIDSFVMVLSVFATFLLINKKIESWYLWILIDLICTVLYFNKGIYFLSLEYLIFLGMAIYGLIYWKKELNKKRINNFC